MQRKRAATAAVAAAVATVLLASCGGKIDDGYVIGDDPGTVEEIDGTDKVKVMLTDPASHRLRIETTPVIESAQGLVVPATAVFVDGHGHWWVYTNPSPNEFVRAEIKVKHETNNQVILKDGPPVGTEVVTVGVAELYGVEDAGGGH